MRTKIEIQRFTYFQELVYNEQRTLFKELATLSPTEVSSLTNLYSEIFNVQFESPNFQAASVYAMYALGE